MTKALIPVSETSLSGRHEIIQLVTFELEDEEYGVEVLSVKEIIRTCEITKMPNTPDYVDGVINLRGTVVPIVSLRSRFMLPSRDKDKHSRILVLEMKSGKLVGFIVDSVAEVIRVDSDSIQAAPDITHQAGVQDCIIGILNDKNKLLILLDLNLLITEDEHEGFAEAV